MERIWSEIRNDFEDNGIVHIDAWTTADDNENGSVIAKIDLATGEVVYNDDRAKKDEYAQEMIGEILDQRLVDRVLDEIKKDVLAGDLTAVEELILNNSKKDLIAYLPEDEWESYK